MFTKVTIDREQTFQPERESYVRIIGDIHDEWKLYHKMIRDAEYTVQLGDLAVNYSYLFENRISNVRHRFFAGNHDNYDELPNVSHNLGDFGTYSIPEFGEFFFVRGAWSIDHKMRSEYTMKMDRRVQPKNLWIEEELTHPQCREALTLYEKVKPKMVISHAAPMNIVSLISNPNIRLRHGFEQEVIRNRTCQLLQAMTDIHRPKVHVFGHYHLAFDEQVDGVTGELMPDDCPTDKKDNFTKYICIDRMKCIDLPRNFIESL